MSLRFTKYTILGRKTVKTNNEVDGINKMCTCSCTVRSLNKLMQLPVMMQKLVKYIYMTSKYEVNRIAQSNYIMLADIIDKIIEMGINSQVNRTCKEKVTYW